MKSPVRAELLFIISLEVAFVMLVGLCLPFIFDRHKELDAFKDSLRPQRR